MILLSCHSLSMECLGTRSPPVTLDVDATFVLGGNRHGFGKAIQRAVLGDASQQFELPRIRVFAGDGAGLQDPAGVHGTGRPSGGTNPATGLVLLQSDIDTDWTSTCTLAAPERDLCNTILSDVIERHQGQSAIAEP